MKSFYSVIRYCNNSLSNENIVIGLVAITNTDVYFKFSDFKINLIAKLNPSNSLDIIKYNVRKMSDFLGDCNVNTLFEIETCSNLKNFFNRLSIYNNGILSFDKPYEIDLEFDNIIFDNFFNKVVGESFSRKRNNIYDEKFVYHIDTYFKKPLIDIIDLDYTINSDVIPSLFFDYKLNGIGANGSIYTVKCIDLNSNKKIENIQKDIAELESLSIRLNDYSEKIIKYPKNNKHYLVIDKYLGDDDDMKDLYKSLNNQKSHHIPFEVVPSQKLNVISKDIIKTNARKFSDLIN